MRLEDLKLEHFTHRGLNMLGHVFGGGDVRVVLSERATDPLTVILESRTVMLNPRAAGVFDLALGVRLLKHRHLRNKSVVSDEEIEKHDDVLTKRAQTQWAAQSRQQLMRDLPGIRRLCGRFQLPTKDFAGLTLTTRNGRLNPLPPPRRGPTTIDDGEKVERGPGIPIALTNIEFVAIPGIDLTGAGDDFSWLIDGLQAGAIPLHHLPQLEDLPFVRIPYRVCDHGNFPAMEWLEQELANAESQEMIRDFMKCIMDKSEVREERSQRGKRTTSGTHLDSSRIVDAVIGARTGSEPKIFRRKTSTIEPVFDPSEHVALIALDLTDIWHNPDSVNGLITILATAYQRLEVDVAILGYAGRLLRLENHKRAYLHFVTEIKAASEPWEEAIWGRLINTVRRPLQLPGEPIHFHPVGFQDIAHTMRTIEREQSHSYRTILWWARRWLRGNEFDHTEFLIRTADCIDFQHAELTRSFDGTLDTLASYLPLRLISHGRPGEYLSGIEIPGHQE